MYIKNSLIVFRIGTHFFGLLPSDFDQHFLLDQVWIKPVKSSSAIWSFEGKKEPRKGFFVQIEALFGYFPAYMSYKGHVFLKDSPNIKNFGIFFGDFQMQISLNRAVKKTLEIDQVTNLPQVIPRSVFHFVLQHKRKKIMVIDPVKLINHYDINFDERWTQ